MNNREYINVLSARTGKTKNETTDLVASVVKQILDGISSGNDVSISGFGNFDVKVTAERRNYNPRTNEVNVLAPRVKMNFRPSVILKNKFRDNENK